MSAINKNLCMINGCNNSTPDHLNCCFLCYRALTGPDLKGFITPDFRIKNSIKKYTGKNKIDIPVALKPFITIYCENCQTIEIYVNRKKLLGLSAVEIISKCKNCGGTESDRSEEKRNKNS